MITFLRFQDYGSGLVAIFADSNERYNENKIVLDENNLAERIANLQGYNIDTSAEEAALIELRKCKSEQ